MKSSKILLTGATGFIGSHLLAALLRRGYSVVILKRSNSDTWRINELIPQIKYYDIDQILLPQVFAENKFDSILHLATLYKKNSHYDDISAMINANVNFPAQLLELAVEHKIKSFINTGTFFEYDWSCNPISETATIKPFNFYAKTKVIFESLLSTYKDIISTTTIRLFSPYGEMDNTKIIPLLINAALNSKEINISGGMQKLDFIYIKDIISAFLKVIENKTIAVGDHNIFNVGTGKGTSVLELISILEKKIGKPILKIINNPQSGKESLAVANCNHAKKILNWEPKYSISAGLDNTIEFYKRKENL